MKQASLPAGARIAGLVGRELALGPVFDAIPTGLAVLDADLRICLMNRALETMTGFTTAEVAGIPCRHVLRASVCLHRCPTRTAVCDATGGNAPCPAAPADDIAAVTALLQEYCARHLDRMPHRKHLDIVSRLISA